MLKGIVQTRMKILSLSIHPHADGKQVKFWCPQNTARVSREGDVALISHIIEAYGGQDSNVQKFIMKPQNISKLLVCSNPSVLKPQNENLFLKTLLAPCF